MVLKINRIDWNNKNTDLQVVDSIEIAKPKTSSSFPDITQVDIKQPVNKTLWLPGNSQIHGPTIHPSGKYIYFNEWTSDRIFKIDVKNDKLQIIKFPGFTEQLHGVFFNQDGTSFF